MTTFRCWLNPNTNKGCLSLLLACLLPGPGCQQASPNVTTVQGGVTVNGRPLSGATIRFDPLPGTKGPKVSAAVFDGVYQVSDKLSMQPGAYRVRIAMADELRPILPAEQLEKLPPEGTSIDPSFDINSTLQCDVVAGQMNQFDFDIHFLKKR